MAEVLQTALDPLHQREGGFCTSIRPGRVRHARAPWHYYGESAGLGYVAGPFPGKGIRLSPNTGGSD